MKKGFLSVRMISTMLTVGIAALGISNLTNTVSVEAAEPETTYVEYVDSDNTRTFETSTGVTLQFCEIKLIPEDNIADVDWEIIEQSETIGIQLEVSEKDKYTQVWSTMLSTENTPIAPANIEKSDVANLGGILAHMGELTETNLVRYDFFGDGTVDIRDLVFMSRTYAYCPVNFLISNGSKMELTILDKLLKQHLELGEKNFKVYSTDKPTVVAETTTTTTTTSTTTSTTTTTPKPTTTTSTTTSTTTTTPKPTTTTSTTTSTTTTTPKPTTTTSTTTSTTTTTPKPTTTTSTTTSTTTTSTSTTTTTSEPVVTSSDVKSELAEINLRSILEKTSPTDTEIPAMNDDTLYEYNDFVYLFEYNGKKYAYTVLAEEKQESNKSILVTPALIKGLHIWKYEGTEDVVGLQDALPDTTGMTFTYKDAEYEYDLEEYTNVNATDIESMSKIIAGTKKLYSIGYMYIQQFDYNLNGELDEDDLQTMVKYYVANIGNMQPLLIEYYLWTYISDMERFGHTNAVMKFSSEVVDYAFIVPCQEYVNANKELMTSVSPVQIVPNSMYDELVEKYGVHGPEEYDFIIWDMYPLSGDIRWTTVSKSSDDWYFTGFYVQVLDDNGNYVQEWIGDIA